MNDHSSKNSNFIRGLKAGIPIGLGYLSVSFTFGIMAVGYGLYWWQAVLISMMTVTSAGQFAGIGVMMQPGQYIEMLVSQLTINIRYSFMSISLSQKTDPRFKGIFRWLLGFMMTDEIFAVASQEEELRRSFFAGLSVLPYLGWSLGTLIGAVLGNILPQFLMSALSLAIYGMFVAIVVPDLKKSRAVLVAVLLAALFSCLFYYVPVLKHVSSGIAISICAIAAAVVAALLFPVSDETEKTEKNSSEPAKVSVLETGTETTETSISAAEFAKVNASGTGMETTETSTSAAELAKVNISEIGTEMKETSETSRKEPTP